MHKSREGYFKYWVDLKCGTHQCKFFAHRDTGNPFSQDLDSGELKVLDFDINSQSIIKGIFNPIIDNSIYIIPYSIIINERSLTKDTSLYRVA